MGGEEIAVNATIHTLGGFSAHASQSQLLDWVSGFRNRPAIYLVHGEQDAKDALKQVLQQRDRQAQIPAHGASIEV